MARPPPLSSLSFLTQVKPGSIGFLDLGESLVSWSTRILMLFRWTKCESSVSLFWIPLQFHCSMLISYCAGVWIVGGDWLVGLGGRLGG